MANIEKRLKRLETEAEGIQNAELYDWKGERVVARITRYPTKDTTGEAILPDGTKRTIDITATYANIIRRARDRKKEGEPVRSEPIDLDRLANLLFLRVDGAKSFGEVLVGSILRRRQYNGGETN